MASRTAERSPLVQLGGFAMCSCSLYLLLCLATYRGIDPSLNRASGDEVGNAGGYMGALLADVSLQTIGLAALLMALVPFTWGVKMLSGRRVTYLWVRATAMLGGVVLAAALISGITPSDSWTVHSGYGGALGHMLGVWFKKLVGNAFFVLFVLAATITFSAIAFGMDKQEWRMIATFFRKIGLGVGGFVYGLWVKFRMRQAAREEEEEEEEYYEESSDAAEEYEEEEEAERAPWYARLMFWRRGDAEEEEEYEEEDEEEEETAEEEEEEEEEEKPKPRKSKKAEKPRKLPVIQGMLPLSDDEYQLPPLSLLAAAPAKSRKAGMNEAALQQNARLLETVLKDFGVQGTITEIRPGPVVTLYELEPAAGTKSSRVIGLADDIARSMSAISARIAVIPGRNALGIELPNATRETVYLREMLESNGFDGSEAKLPLALGKDIGGAPIVVDLARMPHLLVAGTTGSGKSVAINTMILSLAYRLTPEECKFIMIDPKMLELSIYDGIPHLLTPVVTDPGKAVVALKWAVKEMENRYRLMANLSVRNIDGYNKTVRDARDKGRVLVRKVQTGFDPDTGQPIIEEMPLDMAELPYIVVLVDEMADLMLVAGKDIEGSIQRLAQMARAAGIHIIMATQRPSVDVITGVIKANFPTRISFQVTSRIDSRTILGEAGADQLLGQGDMLYMAGGGRITRVHGPFVSDKEVEEIVTHLKAQGEPTYIEDVTRDDSAGLDLGGEEGERDELYDQAVAVVARDRKASTSYIQRSLKIGYNRAATLIERMEREGVVSAANHVGKREVLVPEDA